MFYYGIEWIFCDSIKKVWIIMSFLFDLVDYFILRDDEYYFYKYCDKLIRIWSKNIDNVMVGW